MKNVSEQVLEVVAGNILNGKEVNITVPSKMETVIEYLEDNGIDHVVSGTTIKPFRQEVTLVEDQDGEWDVVVAVYTNHEDGSQTYDERFVGTRKTKQAAMNLANKQGNKVKVM